MLQTNNLKERRAWRLSDSHSLESGERRRRQLLGRFGPVSARGPEQGLGRSISAALALGAGGDVKGALQGLDDLDLTIFENAEIT